MAQQQAQNVMRRYVDKMVAFLFGMDSSWLRRHLAMDLEELEFCERYIQILLGCNYLKCGSIQTAEGLVRGSSPKHLLILIQEIGDNW